MANAVVAHNTMARSNAFVAEGLNHREYLPIWFTEFLNNSIVEGNSYGGAQGSFQTSGFYDPNGTYDGPMAVGIVYRNNRADNGAFTVEGAVADVIFEGNALTNSDPPGLSFINNHTARIYVRGNSGF
mmetsp:Transcript_3263/g.8005  ORF Transcript_3263/g.8005 Transcript_3263/m.8005 type:complete len:128 (+) Transcript_3263:354-737(+)